MRLSQIDGRAGQHQAIAFTALGFGEQLFVGDAINGETMRTGEMHGFLRAQVWGFRNKGKAVLPTLDKWSRS